MRFIYTFVFQLINYRKMKHPKSKICLILIFIAIFSLLFLIDCQKKKDSGIYVKPTEQKLDSVVLWFSDYKNYNDKDFLSKFYTHFNQRLVAQQWESAAQLLHWTGYNLVLNNQTDSLLIQTSIDFIDKHFNDISNKSKSGIYHNIGELFYYQANFKSAAFYLEEAIKTPPTDYYTLINILDSYKTVSYLYTDLVKYNKALEAVSKPLR